jgi:polar amino acid transport system substrate-binding protein
MVRRCFASGWMSLLGVLLSGSFAHNAYACGRPIWIAASPLGLAMVVSEDGQVSGTTREVFTRITATTGCEFEYVVVPRARAFAMLKNGQVDIVSDATQTPDRTESSHFLEIGKATPALVSLARDLLLDTTTTDLLASNFALITIHGHDYGPQYQTFVQHPALRGRISYALTTDNAIRMLMAGRGHAILANPFVLVEAWQRIGQNVELHVSELRGIAPLSHGTYFSKRMEPNDIAKIENGLLAMLRSGELAKISMRQYPDWIVKKFQPSLNQGKPSSGK